MADEKQFLDKDGLEHIIDTQIGKTDISGIGNGTIKGAISTVKDSLTNPNLIDNGWFNVNSRGLSAYGGQVYSVDRWKILDGSKTATYLTINDDGSITLQNTTSGNVYIGQDTEFQGISFNSYKLSVLDNENVIHASSSTSGINLDDGKCYFYLENKRVSIRLLADCNVTIKAIKLEKGSISTLANDTAPDYQTELLKCQTSTADSTDTYANKSLFQPISDAWLSTKAYAVGDYAIHNNLLWKCLVANTGTTPVEGTTWTQTSVGSEVNKISVPIQLTKEDVFKDYEDVESIDGYRIGKIYVITRLIISSTSLSSSKETFSKCHVKSKFYNSSLSPHLLGHTVGTNGYGVYAAIQTYGGTDDGILSMSLTTPNVTHTGRLIFAPFTLVEI